MAHIPQVKIPATYLRGGTSKGVFFRLSDLPERCQQPGPARDAFFLRVIGSPDPYGCLLYTSFLYCMSLTALTRRSAPGI